jgi:hypothetical protein
LYLCVWVPNKYNTTGDLDIVDEIKICDWVLNKYNKPGDLDIVDEIKICDWIPSPVLLYLLGTQSHILISSTISRSPVVLYLIGTQTHI